MEKIKEVIKALENVIKGKTHVIKLGLCCFLAGGHLLLEDLPGTGKTTFALALSRVVGCEFKKVQFTSDLLPSDILGTEVYKVSTGEFSFRPGPIFTNIFLADEINRATPRTQSALLEVMAERRVTVSGKTFELPEPFFLIATQNPLDLYGTYPLPESQLDRFMMRLEMGYPEREYEKEIIKNNGYYEEALSLPQILKVEEFLELKKLIDEVIISESILDYILNIGEKSREWEDFRYGFSTRGLISLKKAAQALAMIEGRSYVIPDDVKTVFIPVAFHRLLPKTEMEIKAREKILKDFLSTIPVPL